MKKIFSIFLLSFISITLFAQTTPTTFDAKALLQPPTGKQQLVNDYTNTLTADQKQTLENKLDAFDDSTSTQVAVVIVPNIGGDEIASYNVKLGRAWGVGGKQFNNGVVLLISKDDHKLNIATGYGAEGALPDVTCSDIIDNVIVPNFKGNDYYRGIDEGTDAIIKAMQGEYTAPEGYHKQSGISIFKIIFIIIIILVVLFGRSGGGGGFLGPFLLGSMLGGGFGGRDSDGGGSGGGFGGFGGGSFGGGGASGSW